MRPKPHHLTMSPFALPSATWLQRLRVEVGPARNSMKQLIDTVDLLKANDIGFRF